MIFFVQHATTSNSDAKPKIKILENGIIEILDDEEIDTKPCSSDEELDLLTPLPSTSQNVTKNLKHGIATLPANVSTCDMSTQTLGVNETVQHECPICYQLTEKPWTIPCGHCFCINCLGHLLHREKCFICSERFEMYEYHEVYLNLS